MTPREGEALTFITDYVRRHRGVSPTIAEVGAGVGIVGRGAAHTLVASLERQGHIHREPGRRRNITVANRLAGFTIAELEAEVSRREAEWSAQQRVHACECGNRPGSAEARDCQRDICPLRAKDLEGEGAVHADLPTVSEGAR